THNSHHCTQISQNVLEITERIEQKLVVLNKKIESYQEKKFSYLANKRDVEESAKYAISSIEQGFSELIQIIKKKEQELIDSIEILEKEKSNISQESSETVQQQIDESLKVIEKFHNEQKS